MHSWQTNTSLQFPSHIEEQHSLISLCSFALLYKRIAAKAFIFTWRCEIVVILVTKLFRVFGGGSSLESHHSCLTFGGKKSVVDVIIPYAM